jgi:hypothetical protein
VESRSIAIDFAFRQLMSRRAGLPPTSQAMHDLVALALSSPHISIHGFYSHFGREYPLVKRTCGDQS